MSNRFLTGRRTGARLVQNNVSKDEEGFDDIESFWGKGDKDLGNTNQISPTTGDTSKSSKSSARFSTSSRVSAVSAVSAVDTPTRYGLTDVSSFNKSSSPGNFVEDDEMMPVRRSPVRNKYNLNVYDDDFSEDDRQATYDDEETVSDASEAPVEKEQRREAKRRKKEKKELEKKEKKRMAQAAKKAKKVADAQKKKAAEKRAREVSVEEEEDDDVQANMHTGMQYVPVTDGEDGDGSEENTNRRSKRRRFEPLKFWKNERLLFKPSGDVDNLHKMELVSVVAQLESLPTPAKGLVGTRGPKKGFKGQMNEGKKFNPADLEFPVETVKESTVVWDEGSQTNKARKVVVRAESLNPSALPITHERPDGNELVGSAAQAFNVNSLSETMPGWISGNLMLPPKAIKDAEGVGECTQVFFVQSCQPGAFEVSLNDPDEDNFVPESAKRFTLKSGDFFHVPPNNIYRIQNHSENVDAKLFWVIIKSVDGESA
jgi:hypothetical protein